MRERESSEEFVRRQLELADEFLSDARDLLAAGSLRSAIDRAYYAMFHAAQAVLFARGIKPKTHVGVIRIFGKEIVEKGLIDRRYGRYLNEAFDARLAGTYEVFAEPGEELAEEIVEKAGMFVEKIREILES